MPHTEVVTTRAPSSTRITARLHAPSLNLPSPSDSGMSPIPIFRHSSTSGIVFAHGNEASISARVHVSKPIGLNPDVARGGFVDLPSREGRRHFCLPGSGPNDKVVWIFDPTVRFFSGFRASARQRSCSHLLESECV